MSRLVLGIAHTTKKLFAVDANGLRHHTLVVGQSGSGKSTFLTRLIEELVARTGGRVLILDPNGDYSRIHQPDEDELKQSADLAALAKPEPLLPLDTPDAFRARWEAVNIQYVGYCKFDEAAKSSPRRRRTSLYVAWCHMDRDDKAALLAVDATTHPALYSAFNLLDDHLFEVTDKLAAEDPLGVRGEPSPPGQLYDLGTVSRVASRLAEKEALRKLTKDLFGGVTADTWNHVHALARQIERRFNVWRPQVKDGSVVKPPAVHVVVENGVEGKPGCWSVCVVGMPPIKSKRSGVKTQEDALLVADSVLSKVWRSAVMKWDEAADARAADARVPLFIVLDEAQLFAPRAATPGLQQRVCDKIIRIAAEGRKYGLHLILSTQRPSKLNEGLIYECENQAILRLQSPAELKLAVEAFDLTDVSEVSGFTRPGECVMRGRWVKDQTRIQSGRRRTVAGGRDLDKSYWLDEARYGSHESRQSRGEPALSAPPTADRPFIEQTDEDLLAHVAADRSVGYLIALRQHAMDFQHPRWRVARAAVEKLLTTTPSGQDTERSAGHLATILYQQGKLAAADKDQRDALTTRFEELVGQFGTFQVVSQYAHFVKDVIAPARAIPIYEGIAENVVKLSEDNATKVKAFRWLAVCYRAADRLADAWKSLNRALALVYNDQMCLAYKATWLAEEGNREDAEKVLTDLLKRHPAANEIEQCAVAYDRLGMSAEAERLRNDLKLGLTTPTAPANHTSPPSSIG